MDLILAPTEAELRVVRAALATPVRQGLLSLARVGLGPEASHRFCRSLPPACGRLALIGWAGALRPDLRRGDVVVASATLDGEGGRAQCASVSVSGSVSGEVLTTAAPVASPQAKAAAGTTGACAAEMEGYPLARWALDHGLAFSHVRVILDEWDEALPDAAGLIDAQGRLAPAGLVLTLARPSRALPLARLAWRARRTEPALAAAARAVWRTWLGPPRA